MDIELIKYHQVNFDKYNKCIQQAVNNNIYAESWYLDVVAQKKWNVLGYNDYEVVMPIPYERVKRKFYQQKIHQPSFCQQLGIFYHQVPSKEVFAIFMETFKKLKPFAYQWNHANVSFLESSKLELKNNFVLNLHTAYINIQKGYSTNLKRNLKKAIRANLQISEIGSVEDFISFKKRYQPAPIPNKKYEIMTKLIRTAIELKQGKILAIYQGKELVAGAFFLITPTRIIHLISATSPMGRQQGSIPFLFDDIIQQYADQNMIFDFEGSMIPGVAQFFKSFGARNEPYLAI